MHPKIEKIALDKFDLSLSGMRILNPAWIVEIQHSMWVHGQLQPVVARFDTGRYQVIDGIKRVYAAIELMMESLECYVLDVDLKQAKLLVLSYNRPHRSMEIWEEAMVLKDLLKRHHLSQHQLSRLTGYSRSWVSRRLSLINKIDEQVVSEIKMGAINSSQARALIRLPRGNQREVARVITSLGLASRLSNTLVSKFLAAENRDQQRYILAHPQAVLQDSLLEIPGVVDNPRLSDYGHALIRSTQYVLSAVRHMLLCLGQERIAALRDAEKPIIIAETEKIQESLKKLASAITHLQTS